MDDLASYNKERWEELAKADIKFSMPWLDLDADTARLKVDPKGMLGDMAGKDVLCLAGAGGQQSAAFALLGARVVVFDLSETMLERDREAAAHYGVNIRTIQGDMRDLSAFDEDSFDIIYHAHSINFVPSALRVFKEAARVIRTGGLYRLGCHNPFFHGVLKEDWNGSGYPLRLPYVDGAEIIRDDYPDWSIPTGDGAERKVPGPKEFRHSLSTIINGMIKFGFVILGAWESAWDGENGDTAVEPGSWSHFTHIVPQNLTFLARYCL